MGAKKNKFCFYGAKYNILLSDEDDGTFVVCLKGKSVCIARQFNSIWFVVAGDVKKKGGKDKEKGGFSGAPDAFNKICGSIFDALAENNVWDAYAHKSHTAIQCKMTCI